jgi:ORF6N domain
MVSYLLQWRVNEGTDSCRSDREKDLFNTWPEGHAGKDLAVLYGVKPIRLREQVKRNIRRFPDDFMSQLDEKEIDFMVSQNAIPSRKYLGGSQPYFFTEQGVAMLSMVLNSDRAIEVNGTA